MQCPRRAFRCGVVVGLGFSAACLLLVVAVALVWPPTPFGFMIVHRAMMRPAALSTTYLARLTIGDPVQTPEPIAGGISGFAVPVPPAHEVQGGEPASMPTTPTRPGAPIRRRRLAELG